MTSERRQQWYVAVCSMHKDVGEVFCRSENKKRVLISDYEKSLVYRAQLLKE